MADQPVRYELRDRISTITIDRPEARNALNRAVREGLWAGFRRFVDDDDALVAILTATGDKVFCAGAAVNGLAYAGGFALAQMCDLCIAAETAKFAITEAKWSRGAPWAAPLPWMIAPRVALELLLTAEPIDAHRAYEIGLVNRVVPLEHLQEEARALAMRIAQNAPLSVRAGKRMVY